MFKKFVCLSLIVLCFNNLVIGTQLLDLEVYNNNITCLEDINSTTFKFQYDLDCRKNCLKELITSQTFVNSKFYYNNKTFYLKDLDINSSNRNCLRYDNLDYSYNLKITNDHISIFISILFCMLLISVILLLIVLIYKASKNAPLKKYVQRRNRNKKKYGTFVSI